MCMIKLGTLLEDFGNDKGKTFYFSYGSNMDIKHFESKYKTAKALRLAYIPNHQLFFDKYSDKDQSVVADIREVENSKVFGVLYKIDPSDLPMLDKQEGGYERKEDVAYDANGNKYNVFTYSVIDKSKIESIPSQKYINHIIIGLKNGMELGPVENKPLKSELVSYMKRVSALDKESDIVDESLDMPYAGSKAVTPNFEKLAITNVKETPTYTKASVMWNGKLIGYVVFSKEKQKYIAMNDGSRDFPAKAFNDEESAINYLKQFSSFTIPITVGGGSEEGSYQSYGY